MKWASSGSAVGSDLGADVHRPLRRGDGRRRRPGRSVARDEGESLPHGHALGGDSGTRASLLTSIAADDTLLSA